MKYIFTFIKGLFLLSLFLAGPLMVSAVDLFVTGITTNSAANGHYVLQGQHPPSNKDYWKHETENFYIYYDEYLTTGTYNWNIDDDLVDDANVLFYSNVDPDPSSPTLVTSWTGVNGTGSPVVTEYSPAGPPTVVTSNITLINPTSATMGGNVTQDGGSAVTETGVVFSSVDVTPEQGEAGVTTLSISSGLGAFSDLVGSLSNGTTYYFQAYATNTTGTSYGGVKTVTPGLIDFELTGFSDGLELGKTTDIHGFTFTINSVDAADDIIFDDNDPNGPGSGALWDDNLNANDITMWTIKKTDGSEFQLKNLYIKQGGVGNTAGTISAFKDNAQVGSAHAVNFNGSSSYSSEPDFFNVDEIRIGGTDLYIFIDDLIFGNPVIIIPPTLTTFSDPIDTTFQDLEVEITFAELAAQGDETDADGTVVAFVVNAVSTGTLKIGASSGSASAFNASTNNEINASDNAYWTPAASVYGTQNAFTTTVKDNDDNESTGAVQATIDVVRARFVGPGTSFNDPANWEGGIVPPENIDIVIAANQYMEVDVDFECRNLKFETGSSFACNGGVLTITGNVLNSLGDVAIEVKSSLVVTSSISINNPIPPP